MPPKASTEETVFRVKGLSLNVDLQRLSKVLENEFGTAINERRSSLCPSPYETRTQNAFIQFVDSPPGELESLSEGNSYELEFDDSTGYVHDITIDRDFYGLTQMYPTKSESKITADVVAVCGLDGHAYDSWRSKGRLRRMWLRHFFQRDLPEFRTMTFGYNSKIDSHSVHTTLDFTKDLIQEVNKVRKTEEESNRPILFIGHSFGGIIVTQTMVRAKEHFDPIINSIYQNTYATIFFGTPHRGLVIDDICAMVDASSPRSDLLASIATGANLLEAELSRFVDLSLRIKILSFHESRETRKLKKVDGKWKRAGDYFTAVEKGSAVLQLPSQVEQSLSAEGDNSDMVKFPNDSVSSYTSVREHILKVTESPGSAPEEVERKSQVLPNGRYTIANAKFFDHRLSALGSADVVATEESPAYWDIRFNPTERNYTIIHVATQRVLDMMASGSRPGTKVIVHPNYNTGNQRWKLMKLPSGNYHVGNVSSPNLVMGSKVLGSGNQMSITSEEIVPGDPLREWIFEQR